MIEACRIREVIEDASRCSADQVARYRAQNSVGERWVETDKRRCLQRIPRVKQVAAVGLTFGSFYLELFGCAGDAPKERVRGLSRYAQHPIILIGRHSPLLQEAAAHRNAKQQKLPHRHAEFSGDDRVDLCLTEHFERAHHRGHPHAYLPGELPVSYPVKLEDDI